MKLSDWINSVNTVSFSSLVNQALWGLGSVVFTAVAAWLMIRADRFNDTGVLIASGSGMRAVGFDLAAALLFAWTGKSAISAASRYGKSTTAVPYVEAKERAQATVTRDAKPQTVVHAEDQSTVKVEPVVSRRRSGELPMPEVATTDTDTVEHEWARGDPREGIL